MGRTTRATDTKSATRKPVEAPKRLPATTRRELEPTFGADLSHVRVHDGAAGARVANAHGARAVTAGSQIYFGRGEYQPRSPEGKELVAHEVAHSLQQSRSGPVATNSKLEDEAGTAASCAGAGCHLKTPLSPASPNQPLCLKRGEKPGKTGPPSKDVAKVVRKQLRRDPEDRGGETKGRLEGASPRFRSEVAEQVRPLVSPMQRVTLELDSKRVRPSTPVQTGPASLESEKKGAPSIDEEASKAKGPAKTAEPEPEKTGSESGPAPAKGESAKSAPTAPAAGPSQAPIAAATPGAPTAQAAVIAGPTAAPAQAPTETPAAAGEAAAPGGAAQAVVIAPPPEPPYAPAPADNPAFQGVKGSVGRVAKKQKDHAPAADATSSAQGSAQKQANETQSLAQASHTDALAEEQPNPFNRAAFKAALLAKVESLSPKNLEEADDFKDSGKAGEVKGAVAGQVKDNTAAAAGAIPATNSAPPSTAGIEERVPETMKSDEHGEAPGRPASSGAVAAPRPEAQTNLDSGPQEIDGLMAQNEITETQLANSNEPQFIEALGASHTAKEHSQNAPQQFRQEEQAALAQEEGAAAQQVGAGVQSMHGKRGQSVGDSVEKQNTAKSRDEIERQRVANEINTIFETTKTAVETRLAKLETDATTEFDQGAEKARQSFEDYVDQRMRAYKSDRYGGLGGGVLWAKDKLVGMPDEVNEFYSTGKDRYLADMDAVVESVATIVETGLTEATALIQKGKADINKYVDELPANLKKFGEEAEQGLANKFSELEQSIEDKRSQLVDTLAQKYVANVKAIDERIEQLQAENRGLIDGAIAFLKAVINAIIAVKNFILDVLSKVARVIGTIISDPIGFLGNLISAIGKGLGQFIDNIGKHLIAGLMGWLFGELASAGVTIPTSFDLKSILGFVLQVLGLTYSNIRKRAVAILGEKVVKALETTAEIFQVLITEGPAGLWRWIKDQFEVLKDAMMEQIKSFIMERIISAGIKWILGLLNPVGAFIKACLAIKDIVVFFIERGRQIMELVSAIIDSVAAIADGNLTAAANWIEAALARSIPVLISLLASILGLGGIGEKVKSIIEKIQEPINKIIDTVIKAAAGAAKAVGSALGIGSKQAEQAGSKEMAVARLQEELAGGVTIPQAKVTIARVERELMPKGIKRIYLDESQPGHPIMIQVNPTTPGAWLRGTKNSKTIRSMARITVDESPDPQKPTITNRMRQTEGKRKGFEATGAVGFVVPTVAATPERRFEPVVSTQQTPNQLIVGSDSGAEKEVTPRIAELSTQVDLSRIMPGSDNATHAESKLLDRIHSTMKDVYPKIQRVEFWQSDSPCACCGPMLANFKTQNIPHAKMSVRWNSLYSTSTKACGATSASTIQDMRNASISVDGPMPSGAPASTETEKLEVSTAPEA